MYDGCLDGMAARRGFFADTVRREYDKVFLGEKTMQEAMSDAKTEIDAALQEG